MLTREIEKLKKMADEGILDADEFKAAKGKLLKLAHRYIISYVIFRVINGQRRKSGGTIAFIEEL